MSDVLARHVARSVRVASSATFSDRARAPQASIRRHMTTSDTSDRPVPRTIPIMCGPLRPSLMSLTRSAPMLTAITSAITLGA